MAHREARADRHAGRPLRIPPIVKSALLVAYDVVRPGDSVGLIRGRPCPGCPVAHPSTVVASPLVDAPLPRFSSGMVPHDGMADSVTEGSRPVRIDVSTKNRLPMFTLHGADMRQGQTV